jgi:hypothetical protein
MVPAGPDDADQTGALSLRAREARKAEKRALRKVETLLSASLANEARAASSVARDHAARAVQLEQQSHSEAEHRARMAESEARLTNIQTGLFVHIIRLFVGALGLRWTEPFDDLLAASLRALTTGTRNDDGRWVVDLPIEAGARAREEVETRWRRELVAGGIEGPTDLDLANQVDEDGDGHVDEDPDQEGQDRRDYLGLDANAGGGSVDSPAAVADSTIQAPDDLGDPEPGLPSWEDLPDDWQQRFSLHRQLGQVEYQRHLEREQRQAELGRIPRRQSRWADFRNPHLQSEEAR